MNDHTLTPTNTKGAYYECIWDAGGTDDIVMNGTKACTIDLRAATGQLEEGGGGFVSFVKGVKGGLTIAVGVTIENATSGKGADLLIGNEFKSSEVTPRTNTTAIKPRPEKKKG